ncbi:sensor histidine kinase [Dyadobacter sp. BHUBP1]|uniref:sensor histidine kinase n=1 Tax=Dyadobacter sp. BHUBP1 TaxID=3424178 RepID=UPI003D338F83
MDKEQQKQGGNKPLNAVMQICNVHAGNRAYRKTLEIYERERGYLEGFPDGISKGTISSKEAINAIYILTPVLFSCVYLKDTARTGQVIKLASAITHELFIKISPQSEDGTIVRFFMAGMHLSKNQVLLRDFDKAKHDLAQIHDVINGPSRLTKEWRSLLNTYYIDWACDYYLKTHNNDSASYYINQYAKTPNISFDQKLRVDAFRASLFANSGKYAQVYPAMEKVVSAKDSLSGVLMQEMDELLYAHTQAENDRNELALAEQEKKQKNNIIVAISVLSILVVGLLFYWSQQRQRTTKRRIEQLNRMAQMQVAELEEIKQNERSQEQQRLGRELHDQLSSSVASVKYRLERISNQPALASREEITAINVQINDIYTAVRDKSHEWASQPLGMAEKSFEERIKALASVTLPESAYRKTIEIDDYVLSGFSISDKIQILYIIQEAVTNILKHAKASLVNIMLYNEGGQKILIIEDNGRGFKANAPDTGGKRLGLKSIKIRASQLNGVFQIESSEDFGTRLRIIMS